MQINSTEKKGMGAEEPEMPPQKGGGWIKKQKREEGKT